MVSDIEIDEATCRLVEKHPSKLNDKLGRRLFGDESSGTLKGLWLLAREEMARLQRTGNHCRNQRAELAILEHELSLRGEKPPFEEFSICMDAFKEKAIALARALRSGSN